MRRLSHLYAAFFPKPGNPATDRDHPDTPKAPSYSQRRRRGPLTNRKFTIGIAAVAALVALRVGIGFHFFYEGVWKIKHHNEFTAEPFLSQAKGPVSQLFYSMLPDINGKERLKVVEKTSKSGKKERDIDSQWLAKRWEGMQASFVAFYEPQPAEGVKPADTLDARSKKVLEIFKKDVGDYLKENADDIAGYFDSLKRYGEDEDAKVTAPYEQKRRWDKMMDLRKEAGVWIKEIETREAAMQNRMMDLLSQEQQAKGPMPASWNPLEWTRVQQLNFAVTAALTAIGFCLILGLFTQPAALGGAVFMLTVVMTQPAWPTIYPPDPPMVGHALLVNKDFVEMLALLVLAAAAAGRWGGLDFFLHHMFIEPFLSKRLHGREAAKKDGARQNA